MNSRPLGASEIDASVVAFGAWAIGGWMWGGAEEKTAIKAIHAAIDAGITLIDTAPMYGFGRSEEIVGKALKGKRDQVVLATKCGMVWHVEKGDYFFSSTEKQIDNDAGGQKVYLYLNPESIRYEVEKSLTRLKVDYIDLYQTHWQDSTTAIEDTMGELMRLKEEGKIRAIGCSNASIEQMDEYRQAGILDVDQEKYSMLDREHETSNLPYCADNGIAFLAYSPLAQGLLTGKIGPDRTFNDGDQRKTKPRYSVENRRIVAAMLERFKPIAQAHNATLGQVAIAWTLRQRGCSHILAGARTPEQAIENAGAGSIELADDEVAAITAAVDEHSSRLS